MISASGRSKFFDKSMNEFVINHFCSFNISVITRCNKIGVDKQRRGNVFIMPLIFEIPELLKQFDVSIRGFS